MIMKKKNDCPKSRAMTEEFLDYFPVAHSNMRIKVSAQNYRMFIDHGKGARLYDVFLMTINDEGKINIILREEEA